MCFVVIVFLLGKIAALATPSSDLLTKARYLLGQEKDDAALEIINTLIERDPNHFEALSERSHIYFNAGKFERALKDCDKAIFLNPGLVIAYAYRAAILVKMARFDEALKDCNKAIELNPNLALPYSIRALVNEHFKNYKKELDDYDKAISLAPNNFSYYLFRATALRKQRKYNFALNDCNKALNLNVKATKVYTERGFIYLCQGKFQLAVTDYTTAIKLSPRSFEAYSLRSDAYKELGQYQKQINDLTFASQINPNVADIYERLGYAYFRIGKFKKAVDDYSSTIKISPSSATYARRSDAYRELGEYQKQIDDLTVACKLEPGDANLYEKRFRAYLQLGQLQNAIQDYCKVSNLEIPSTDVHRLAAVTYEQLGKYGKALDLKSKVLKKESNNAFDWSSRAKTYEQLGKFDLAQADWRRAIELASVSERLEIELCNPLIDFTRHSKKKIQFNWGEQSQVGKNILSFQYDDEDHICLPALIDGKLLFLMLDTGCNHTELWKHSPVTAVRKNNIKLVGSRASGKNYTYGFSKLQNLKLGKFMLYKVPVAINDGLVQHKTLSGFLGGNILENFVLTVDYFKRQVCLNPSPEFRTSKKAIVVPMTIYDHRPYCSVLLSDNLEVKALLDTGCPFSLAADALVSSISQDKSPFDHFVSGPWIGKLRSKTVKLKTLRLGGRNFKNYATYVFPASQAPRLASEIILGHDFLSRFKRVTFDYLGKRVIFEPKE